MTSKKKVKEDKKPKFTLDSLLHRVQRLPLTSDVVIDGVVVPDFKIAWVNLRGSQDPVYISRTTEYLSDYRDAISIASEEEDDAIRNEMVADATSKFTAISVACAIEDWDEDFFGKKFDVDHAIEIFQEKKNFLIYNQMAIYMQKASDFLPNASQLQ